jgi:hypothetical protein
MARPKCNFACCQLLKKEKTLGKKRNKKMRECVNEMIF